jgi:phospholipase/carboxylesterase
MIHRFVRGSKLDTLLLLHGTGGDEDDLLALGRDLDPEANLLSPRGQVLENGMPRFFRRLALGVFDLEDLAARTHELARFVNDAVETYELDPSGITAVGYSNGANIAASLLLLHPGLLSSAALLHAMVPFEPEEPPALEGTPVLVTAGRRDQMVTPDQAKRLAEILKEAGADVTLEWQPGGHELTQAEFEDLRTWLESHLKGASP